MNVVRVVFAFRTDRERRTNGMASCAEGAANSETTMTEQRKAVIKNADMSEDMQQEAVDCASQALSKYNIEKVSEREGQDTAETAACGNWLANSETTQAWSTPHVGAWGANNSQRGFAVERMGVVKGLRRK